MRRALIPCFDDFVVGTNGVYTASRYEDPLGAYDKIAFQVIADEVQGSSTVGLTVAIEASNDRRNWVQKSTTPEVDNASLSSSGANVFVGTDDGTIPTMAYVRLRLKLAGTDPSAHVRVIACLRDDA